jgi:hypothetical protein
MFHTLETGSQVARHTLKRSIWLHQYTEYGGCERLASPNFTPGHKAPHFKDAKREIERGMDAGVYI